MSELSSRSHNETNPGSGSGDQPPPTPCTCAALRRTARRATRFYDEALRPSGLRLTQYSVLANVQRADGPTVTELARLLEMDRTTLTRNLRPLAKAGLLQIVPGGDQRCRAVEITPEGEAAVARALPLWQEAERRFRKAFGRETSAELRRLLDDAMESLS